MNEISLQYGKQEQFALVMEAELEQEASDRLLSYASKFEARVEVNDDNSYSMVLPSINDRIINDSKLEVKVDFIPEHSRELTKVVWLGKNVFDAGAMAQLQWLAWIGGCRIFSDAEGYYFEIPCFEGSEADDFRRIMAANGNSEEETQVVLNFENQRERLGRTLEEAIEFLEVRMFGI